MIGKKFGKITVLEFAGSIQCGKSKKGSWLVQCICGKKFTVITGNLKKTKSCGCSRNEFYTNNIKDLTGKQFGKWKVIEYAENSKWLCRCDCGNIKEISGSILKRGESKSCGCLKQELVNDLTGKVFGRLTVLKRAENNKNRRGARWECYCKCGNIVIIRGDGLKFTRSCGCILATRNGLSTNKKEYMRFRLKDPIIRLRKNISHSVGVALKTTNNTKNGGRTFDYLPYTLQQLKEHLESQFEPWMNWDNYGGMQKIKNRHGGWITSFRNLILSSPVWKTNNSNSAGR